MPPFVVPPLMKALIGAASAAAAVAWAVRETRRVNEELRRDSRVKVGARQDRFPTLRRDPVTGEWRVP